MSKNTKFEQSSGNVFKDLGFSDAEAEQELLKADLAFEFTAIDNSHQPKRGKSSVLTSLMFQD